MEKDCLYHKKYDLLQFCAGETFKTILADPPGSFRTGRAKWRRSISGSTAIPP